MPGEYTEIPHNLHLSDHNLLSIYHLPITYLLRTEVELPYACAQASYNSARVGMFIDTVAVLLSLITKRLAWAINI